MKLCILDNRGGNNNPPVYFGIIGQTADGQWGYLHSSTGAFGAADAPGQMDPFPDMVDFMPVLSGQITQISGPIIAGRCYLSQGQGLTIPISSAAFMGPDFLDPADANGALIFDKIEFTLTDTALNCNTTCVDFFGLPLTIELTGGAPQGPVGIDKARNEIFGLFGGVPWSGLVLGDLRILNPGKLSGTVEWLDPYIGFCWDYYSAAEPLRLIVDGQSVGGYPDKGIYSFTIGADTHQVQKPTSTDVFACAGALAPSGSGSYGQADAQIKQQIAAALNRGVFTRPYAEWTLARDLYRNLGPVTPDYITYNGYAASLHSKSLKGLCYAFAFDDVGGFSTDISAKPGDRLTITLY